MVTTQHVRIWLVAAAVAGAVSAQTSVDLTSWTPESYQSVAGFGSGVWNVAAGGASVLQTVNGQPTFFVSPFNAFNLQLEGQISSSGGGDDDYLGFALGFDPGESTNPAADYLLVDWKKGTQFFNFGTPGAAYALVFALEGLLFIVAAGLAWRVAVPAPAAAPAPASTPVVQPDAASRRPGTLTPANEFGAAT